MCAEPMARPLPGFGFSAAQGIASSGIGNVEVRAIRGLANQKLFLERIPDLDGDLASWEGLRSHHQRLRRDGWV